MTAMLLGAETYAHSLSPNPTGSKLIWMKWILSKENIKDQKIKLRSKILEYNHDRRIPIHSYQITTCLKRHWAWTGSEAISQTPKEHRVTMRFELSKGPGPELWVIFTPFFILFYVILKPHRERALLY